MGVSRYYLVKMVTSTNPNRADQFDRLDSTVQRELQLQFGNLVKVWLLDADAEAVHDVLNHAASIEELD